MTSSQVLKNDYYVRFTHYMQKLRFSWHGGAWRTLGLSITTTTLGLSITTETLGSEGVGGVEDKKA